MTVGGVQALVVILALFSAWHAWITLGPRLATAFLVITVVTSWTLEEVGVATGLVYGGYRYTAALGPSIGAVPILIPLAWFALAYPTSVLVDLVAGRWVGGSPGGLRRLLALAAAGALLMTAWDIALDPILSGPTYRAWVWDASRTEGAVPAQNYLGWLATAFAIFLAFRLVQRRASGAGTDGLLSRGRAGAARSIA